MKNKEVFGLQGASQNVGYKNIQEVLFIGKTNVLPGHVGVLDRSKCTQAQAYVRLIAASVLEHTQLLSKSMAQQWKRWLGQHGKCRRTWHAFDRFFWARAH
jgi:hypothetical protein